MKMTFSCKGDLEGTRENSSDAAEYLGAYGIEALRADTVQQDVLSKGAGA
jgi:hypothetical protein